MANITPSVLKQASRLASKSTLSSAARRSAFTRVANSQISRAQSRSYVSETKRNDASITDTKIETAIRLDKKDFEHAGLSMNAQQNGSEVSVSPMAGTFSCGG
jgi:cysteine desulfurase